MNSAGEVVRSCLALVEVFATSYRLDRILTLVLVSRWPASILLMMSPPMSKNMFKWCHACSLSVLLQPCSEKYIDTIYTCKLLPSLVAHCFPWSFTFTFFFGCSQNTMIFCVLQCLKIGRNTLGHSTVCVSPEDF